MDTIPGFAVDGVSEALERVQDLETMVGES